MNKSKEYPVRIVSRTHTHAGEHGVIRTDAEGKTEVMNFGKAKMFKVWLTDCPEGQETAWATLHELARAGVPHSLT